MPASAVGVAVAPSAGASEGEGVDFAVFSGVPVGSGVAASVAVGGGGVAV
ncbi:hypothetical protein SBADM41S_12327 [Streptomyces badius]